MAPKPLDRRVAEFNLQSRDGELQGLLPTVKVLAFLSEADRLLVEEHVPLVAARPRLEVVMEQDGRILLILLVAVILGSEAAVAFGQGRPDGYMGGRYLAAGGRRGAQQEQGKPKANPRITSGLSAGEQVVWLHNPKDGPLIHGRAVARVESP